MPYAVGVAMHETGQVRREVEIKAQVLLVKTGCEQVCNTGNHGRQVKVESIDCKLACFNLGQVQYVIDDRQQGFSGLVDDADQLFLFLT
nr:hypothetical protein [Kordiimonas aestuarii]